MKALGQIRILIGITTIATLVSPTAQAQIIRANDSTNTVVNTIGNQSNITDGTRSGANLFHSFQQFNLPTGTANFVVPGGVENVLARVTGGSASLIQGTLKLDNKANLYFMNPAGIIFGKDARLDINGAFVATTANGIGFGHGKWFSAIGQNNYPELTGLPTQFAFTENSAGSIVQASGTFKSQEAQQIVLIGGTILAPKHWETEGGVVLATVAGKQVVNLRLPGQVLSLAVQVDPLQFGQTVPNRWTIPIPSLPSLLTGSGVQAATDVQVNPDGSLSLTAAPADPVRVKVNPGDVVIHSLKTPPTTTNPLTPPGNQYDILVDAQNTFRAVEIIPDTKLNSNKDLFVPVSVRTVGRMTIRHGGERFTEGIGYQRDAKGIVLKDEINQRIFFAKPASKNDPTQFKDEQGNAVNPTQIDPIKDPLFDSANIPPTESYTKGIIAIQNNNGNGSLLGVLQDSADSRLPSSGDITVARAVRIVPPDTVPIDPTSLTKDNLCPPAAEPIVTASRGSAPPTPTCKTRSTPSGTTTPILKVEPSVNESFKTSPELTPDRPR